MYIRPLLRGIYIIRSRLKSNIMNHASCLGSVYNGVVGRFASRGIPSSSFCTITEKRNKDMSLREDISRHYHRKISQVRVLCSRNISRIKIFQTRRINININPASIAYNFVSKERKCKTFSHSLLHDKE